MAFVFRLERVLSVRRIQEESARQKNAEAQELLLRARQAVEEHRLQLRAAQEGLDRLKHTDQLTEHALYFHTLHVAGLRRQIDRAADAARQAEEAAEQAAAELLAAHQAREALERLREREELLWRRQQAQQEARTIDEIAVMRHRSREEENHGP